ncbi:Predicted arabinose efflux permease, MFS family [Austwickia chelonae]|uniref:Putative major facilitator superfamily transporter n=1 Tax=Austwickia chelonae NBRC 105200 TaxID=1184607 RepID=K6WAA7_9MICO|nr:MFS transporter [Austwickia chelonae]GAB78772.1 putative major facilitator superfamily transporter [Austwickia chelonae NBRC 105200]SEW35345.1 Predicted arabinose efflux permease, MFS family [Austwickia chelonae]
MTTYDETRAEPDRSVWRNTDWLRLLVGNTATTLGSTTGGIAFPLLAYALTGSVGAASVIASVSGFAYILTGSIAGVAVDRIDRRRLMIGVDAIALCAFLGMGILLWHGAAQWWSLLVIVAIAGARQAVSGPAHMASVSNVLPRDQLPTAVAVQQATSSASQLAGPPLGGLAYALGAAVPFFITVATYAADILILFGIRTPLNPPHEKRARSEDARQRARQFLDEVTAGLRFLWAATSRRILVLLSITVNLAISIYYVSINLRLVSAGVHPGLIGAFDAAAAAGLLLGSFLAPKLVNKLSLWRLIVLMTLTAALTWIPAAFAGTNVTLLCTASFVMMIPIPATNAVSMSYIQVVTPEDLQGRVLAASYVISAAAQPAGPLLTGAFLTTLGSTTTVLIPVVAVLALSLVVMTNQHLRNLDTPDTW